MKFSKFLALACVLFLTCSCGDKVYNFTDPDGENNNPGAGGQNPNAQSYILIASGDTNHRGVTSFNLDGSLDEFILDLRAFGSTPNGLATHPDGSFLMSTDGADSILQSNYKDDFSFFYGSGLLNGSVYDIEYNSSLDYFYVVESANIEVFDSNGTRVDGALIPKTLGACVLVAPRNIHITNDGTLYVADYTADRIHKYDVSSPTPTCINSMDVSGTRPYGVIKHSNGLLYFSSFTSDAVYTYNENTDVITNIFEPGLSVLRDPKGLVELPDGDVIVSSSVLDTIERIDESGLRQGISPFINGIYSLNITDIEIVTK